MQEKTALIEFRHRTSYIKVYEKPVLAAEVDLDAFAHSWSKPEAAEFDGKLTRATLSVLAHAGLLVVDAEDCDSQCSDTTIPVEAYQCGGRNGHFTVYNTGSLAPKNLEFNIEEVRTLPTVPLRNACTCTHDEINNSLAAAFRAMATSGSKTFHSVKAPKPWRRTCSSSLAPTACSPLSRRPSRP